jgi:hypothetical protein
MDDSEKINNNETSSQVPLDIIELMLEEKLDEGCVCFKINCRKQS